MHGYSREEPLEGVYMEAALDHLLEEKKDDKFLPAGRETLRRGMGGAAQSW